MLKILERSRSRWGQFGRSHLLRWWDGSLGWEDGGLGRLPGHRIKGVGGQEDPSPFWALSTWGLCEICKGDVTGPSADALVKVTLAVAANQMNMSAYFTQSKTATLLWCLKTSRKPLNKSQSWLTTYTVTQWVASFSLVPSSSWTCGFQDPCAWW